MYIHRPALEAALKNGLRGNLHLLIHGESGSGKSWLYKKTLSDLGGKFLVANLANASRLGGISAELKNLIDREGKARKVSYEEEKSTELNAGLASGGLSHTGAFEIGQMEPFEACIASLRRQAGDREAVLVFDNLEAVFSNKDLLKELADLVILCDDERYAKYRVKILIVGVPSGVKEYYYATPHHATVANRLSELPEVARLTQAECAELVRKGFFEKLRYEVDSLSALQEHVAWVTNRVPQVVHEYCLHVAYLAEANRKVTPAILDLADKQLLRGALYQAYSVVESHMNERDTRAGRRNQTLYALSLCAKEEFKFSDVEALLRREFPTSTQDTALNLAQMLSGLAGGDRPLIRRSPKGDAYTFADSRYRMAMRAMLYKTPDERVERKSAAEAGDNA